MVATATKAGKIVQIIGSTFDVEFGEGHLPEIYNALRIDAVTKGGLKIGLRKFPDEKGDPLGRKPIWYLYQALGTPKEDEVAKQYLKTIGIKSWDEAIYKETIR